MAEPARLPEPGVGRPHLPQGSHATQPARRPHHVHEVFSGQSSGDTDLRPSVHVVPTGEWDRRMCVCVCVGGRPEGGYMSFTLKDKVEKMNRLTAAVSGRPARSQAPLFYSYKIMAPYTHTHAHTQCICIECDTCHFHHFKVCDSVTVHP